MTWGELIFLSTALYYRGEAQLKGLFDAPENSLASAEWILYIILLLFGVDIPVQRRKPTNILLEL
jgi:hypothetical protein